MLLNASLFFDAPLVTIGVLAVLAAALASRLRLSPWWVLLPGAIATGVAAILFSPVATCDAADSVELGFAGAILIAIGFYVGTSLTALVDAIRLVRRGAKGRAALRLLPFFIGAALAFGTFSLAILSFLSCLN
jgi:hypothetical protein